jgi:hypothetical protein
MIPRSLPWQTDETEEEADDLQEEELLLPADTVAALTLAAFAVTALAAVALG